MLLQKLTSRKFLVVVGTVAALMAYGQFEAAAALASAYVLGQGAVDAFDKYSDNRGRAEVTAKQIEVVGPINPD